MSKFYLEKIVFVNRAPFENLEIDFQENAIAVLTSINGRGKTTILSHIVDAFHEMARPHFKQDFQGIEDKFYRISSPTFNMDFEKPSFAYLRFDLTGEKIDYIDIEAGYNFTAEDYNNSIFLPNKIPFEAIHPQVQELGCAKLFSNNLDKVKVQNLFDSNLATYFPSYRFETPGYLNDPYKIELSFQKKTKFSGTLKNPIEVVTGLSQLANWMLDIFLDLVFQRSETKIIENINLIATRALISKELGDISVILGPRNHGALRLKIAANGKVIYPSVFNLSSGENACLSMFWQILRQADNINPIDLDLDKIQGIVLIDEIDKHLHIKMQKEVLPNLLKLFPNVQFITSSHSPFFSMGLAEEISERSRIIDLDNMGIIREPYTQPLYSEVYEMMIKENTRFREGYLLLEQKVKEGNLPLIITEGKTDVKHLKKAKERLGILDLDIELYETQENLADSKLKSLLENLSKIKQSRKVIGIFDRDVKDIIKDIEKDDQPYKNYGNNVYAFCIPKPPSRAQYENISIEFYYQDNELKKEKDGKCLHFDNEVATSPSAMKKLFKCHSPEGETIKKIYDKDIGGEDWIHSKSVFADLVESDESFAMDFQFDNFKLIFDKIQKIIGS
jgi:predicted ATP-binding protein involved in virulence